MPDELHIKDQQLLAEQLNISLEVFSALVKSANKAYEYFKSKGPFYGKEGFNEPTFRITAEPIVLPEGSEETLHNLGKDLLLLGRSLDNLPKEYKEKIGNDLDFKLPITFRIDSILTQNGELLVNEIEGMDGASSLMVAEQLAYDLKPVESLTPARLVDLFKKLYSSQVIKIAFVRSNVETNPYTANAKRFIELIEDYSKQNVKCELFDIEDLKSKEVTPNWKDYNGVFNDTYLSPVELFEIGVSREQLLTAGNYSALVVKGLFALVFEENLTEFFKKEIGKEALERLRNILIPTHFINSENDLLEARKSGKVVKVAWAKDNMAVANRSAGVAMPVGEITHATDDRWKELNDYLKLGYTLVVQDFVEPAKVEVFLKKKMSLEKVNWYNRICVKFVPVDNPNGEVVPEINITAIEATLGPEIIPAGRACAFTAAMVK